MRRKIDVPIICQHESINTTIPENITSGPPEVAITTEMPNTPYQWTPPQEESNTEQMRTTLNGGTFETLDTTFETFDLTTTWTEEITAMKSKKQYIIFPDNSTYIYAR